MMEIKEVKDLVLSDNIEDALLGLQILLSSGIDLNDIKEAFDPSGMYNHSKLWLRVYKDKDGKSDLVIKWKRDKVTNSYDIWKVIGSIINRTIYDTTE